jgi:asparagine synthase (glutamine-hydrolysing)
MYLKMKRLNAFSGCGILGAIIKGSDFIPEDLKNRFVPMLDSLKHRGPDGFGVYSKNNVILGHRRLSILDTSNKGRQPMTRDHLTITFNGEIYNFLEVRKILQSLGYSFTSETDTEVVLRSYQHWGAEALHKLNGMFALAIWDETNQQLFCARDRLGKKPFYYYSDNRIFIFGSEIQPLLLSGYINAEINYNAFTHQLFATSFLETDSTRTLVKNVNSLAPGHYMYLSSNGDLSTTKYWDIPEQKIHSETDKKELINKLEELFDDSIRLRMISDVSVSAFLSGGIDSSLINLFASKHTSEILKSLTITYSDGGSDPYSDSKDLDLFYSKAFIEHLKSNIDHHIISLQSSDITVEAIDKIIDLASLSDDDRMISIYKNYECVKNSGLKVVLNGQGADEIMCGYIGIEPFYKTMFDVQNPDKEIIINMFPARTIIKPHILNQSILNEASSVYQNVFEYYNTMPGKPDEKIHRFLSKTQLLRVLQMEDFLSMRNSVESRLPFLDYRIIEFAFGIPFHHHYHPKSRTGKLLLRNISSSYLPDNITNRPKQAFPSSRSQEKLNQLMSIYRYNRSEIMNCELIKIYFDKSILTKDELPISLNELWNILIIWRFEKAVKCTNPKFPSNPTLNQT